VNVSVAPCASMRFLRSALALLGITISTGTPMMRPIIAYAMPAFPDELSSTVLPGLRCPSSSAPSSMRSTGRSLSEPPGFKDSSFANTSTSGSSLFRISTGTSGVSPTARSTG